MTTAASAVLRPAPRAKGIDGLLSATPPAWAAHAALHFAATLADHAHCEKKAAGHAMALIAQYPHHDFLLQPLAALAQEELRHFRAVLKLLQARGVSLGPDPGDPYVKRLLGHCRHGETTRLLDRLLVAAVVEARSAERLALLGEALREPALRSFYQMLARAEAGHHRLFVRLAQQLVGAEPARARHREFLAFERDAIAATPIAARIH